MEPTDDTIADDLGLGWAVPLDEPTSETTVTPRLWVSSDEPPAGGGEPPFRTRPEDGPPPPNGSFFHLRKRGDAA